MYNSASSCCLCQQRKKERRKKEKNLRSVDLLKLREHDLQFQTVGGYVFGLEGVAFCIHGLEVWAVVLQLCFKVVKRV
jgi:hypothetical protein